MTLGTATSNFRNVGTNLVIHHGISDVLNQTGQRFCILDVVEKTRNFSPFCDRVQDLEGLFQFPECFASEVNHKVNTHKLPYEFSSSLYLPDFALRRGFLK
jgi:hypothetical protein